MQGQENQTVISRSLAKFCSENRCDFILSTGNNFYPSGTTSTTDPQFKTSFLDIYDQISLRNLTWYPVLGNVDYYSSPGSQVRYSAIEKRWGMASYYYSFQKDASNYFHSVSVQFTMMDTTPLQSFYRNDPKN